MVLKIVAALCGLLILLTGLTSLPLLWDSPKTRFYRRLLGDRGARIFFLAVGGWLIWWVFQ